MTENHHVEMSASTRAQASSAESCQTAFTELPPSCVLYAPRNPDLVVVGTYFLDESATVLEKKKTGSLLLYKHIYSNDGSSGLCVLTQL